MSITSTIWMGEIGPRMTEKDIINCFLRFNIKPQTVKLIKDKKTNMNKNYCFVNFGTIEEANSVLFKLNGKKIPGYPNIFRLNWANCGSSFNKSAYIGNLSPDVDDIKLYNLFKLRYPTVHHASVITNNGVSKGYGFVLFNGKEEYEKCLKEMNGIKFYGKILKVREQKEKKNIKKNVYNEESLFFINDLEQNNGGQFGNRENNNIINNINNINNSKINLVPILNENNNIVNNEIIMNIDNNTNNITNSKISKGINNINNIPISNINNINKSNKILFNCNLATDRSQY